MSSIESEESRELIRSLRLRTRELIHTWQREKRFDRRNDAWMRGCDLTISKDLAKHGLLGLSWPKQYGGAELPAVGRLAVTEELLRVGAPIAAHWIAERQIGPSIIRHGNERLRAEILPGIINADVTFCIGMSETEAGSDLAALRTRAIRGDHGWLISGTKTWTTQAHRSTHMYVLARTSTGATKQDGLTEFVVGMDSPGITVQPIHDMSGEHHFNQVILEDVLVEKYRVIGEVGNGWTQVTEQLSFERGGAERYLSTYPLLAELMRSVRNTPDRSAVEKVGALIARLMAIRQLAWVIATEIDAGRAPVIEAAKLKYLGTSFEKEVVEVGRYVLDVTNGSDLGSELLADAMFSLPAGTIRGGATEVLLTLIARAELRK